MKLTELVDQRCIAADLAARDRAAAIRELVQLFGTAGFVAEDDVEKVTKSILSRERSRGTTGFGKGVALPHAKIDGLPRVMAAVGRSAHGIDYDSHDGQPVFGIILVLSPTDQTETHLKAMELVYKQLQGEKFRKFLRQSDTPEKIYDLLREADERLLT